MANSIREWLKSTPFPARLVAQFGDGSERTIKVGSARSRWRDAESAIAGAVHCEALDAEGDTLRVWHAEPATQAAAAASSPVTDPMSMLVQMSRLLADAADRSAERHEAAYRLAYEQQTQLVTVVVARLQSLEAAWHEVVLSQREEPEADAASSSDDLVRQVLTLATPAVVGGMFGTPPAPPSSAPAPNGGKS